MASKRVANIGACRSPLPSVAPIHQFGNNPCAAPPASPAVLRGANQEFCAGETFVARDYIDMQYICNGKRGGGGGGEHTAERAGKNYFLKLSAQPPAMQQPVSRPAFMAPLTRSLARCLVCSREKSGRLGGPREGGGERNSKGNCFRGLAVSRQFPS